MGKSALAVEPGCHPLASTYRFRQLEDVHGFESFRVRKGDRFLRVPSGGIFWCQDIELIALDVSVR